MPDPLANTRIRILVGDITTQQVDAVVNAANSSLAGGGGVDGAIHRAAGPELAGESRALAPCPTGEARTTRGYRLPASWVIHAVGPVYRLNSPEEAAGLLASAYRNSLGEAVRVGAKTVAFPAISTGVYGYPKEEAARIAVSTVADFLAHDDTLQEVRLVCFGEESAATHRAALASLSSPPPLLGELVALVESFLERAFLDPAIPPRLGKAMRYSLLAGGKRLRPVLCLDSALACAYPEGFPASSRPAILEDALPFAAALEMIHTYSLIHDDLPAMDDDDLRRGRPSCHKAFDEGTAILAGDALLTDAFGYMARASLPAERVLAALALAADAAGAAGMAGGQMLDLEAEFQPLSREALREMNAKKTGALLRAACECGAALAGAGGARREAMRRYGQELGFAFQITDDMLDVAGDPKKTGKPAGHDARRGKAAWPALLGMEASRELAREHCRAARDSLTLFSGPAADVLHHLARGLADRVF